MTKARKKAYVDEAMRIMRGRPPEPPFRTMIKHTAEVLETAGPEKKLVPGCKCGCM